MIGPGGGHDRIQGFAPSRFARADQRDRIDVSAFGITSFDELQSFIVPAWRDLILRFEEGTMLTVKNLRARHAQAQDVIFAPAAARQGAAAQGDEEGWAMLPLPTAVEGLWPAPADAPPLLPEPVF